MTRDSTGPNTGVTRVETTDQILTGGRPASFSTLETTGPINAGAGLSVSGQGDVSGDLSVAGAVTVAGAVAAASLSSTGQVIAGWEAIINRSALAPQAIHSVTYTVDASLQTSGAGASKTVVNIDASAGGQHLWANYHTVNWQVDGGDNTAGAQVSTGYSELIRSTPTPGSFGFASYSSAVDATNQPSSVAGGLRGHQINLQANDVDDAGTRLGLLINLGRQDSNGVPPQAAAGILISGPGVGSWRSGLVTSGRFSDAVIDISKATFDDAGLGYGVRLGDNKAIAFDTAGNSQVQFNAATGATEVTGGLTFLDEIVITGPPRFGADTVATAGASGGYLPARLKDGTPIRIAYSLAAEFTLVGITLNGGTAPINVSAGVSTGFSIGTINVVATDGTFSGSLAISGPDAAHFSVGGQTGGVVVVTDTLAVGTYNFTITATQTGVAGSPVSQAFSVVATAGVALAGITLNGGTAPITLTATVPDTTTVGTLALIVTGGSFTGTLDLSGPDAAHFSIVGLALKASGSLSAATYNFTVTATQAGAAGSPLAQAFSVIVVPAIALTGITLNGGTGAVHLTAPVADASTVGTLAVISTNGTFSGTLALSGADAASFTIVGLALKAVGSLAAATYSFTVTATQAGATGSPLAQAFSVVVAAGVALAGVTINGGTSPINLTATVASGTTVGTLAVITTGGSFSGTIALSGADVAHFILVGLAVKANGALTAATYHFTATATQGGAAGSPLAQAFSVVVAPNIALTGITLNGGTAPVTVTAPVANAATVGTLAVQATNGTFSGTLALSGPDAAHFSLSGLLLKASGTLTTIPPASTTYRFTVTATQAGATGSPKSQAFSVVAIPVSVTLTGITLNGSTAPISLPSPIANDTVIGTVAVVATGGTFTGTLGLSGTDAAHFALSGSTLKAFGSIAAGTYHFNVTATMATAAGSPLVQAFSVVSVASGVTAFRIADLLEGFGANFFTNAGQGDGSTKTVPVFTYAIDYWTAKNGMGSRANRIYCTGADESALPVGVSAIRPAVTWGVAATAFGVPPNAADMSALFATADALLAGGALAWVEGVNEINGDLGLGMTAGQGLVVQQALFDRYQADTIVLETALIDSSSNTYTADFWGGDLGAAIAATEQFNGHDYPNSGSPSEDMWRRSGMIVSEGMPSPGAITEFHPALYNFGATPAPDDATQAYWTVCALLTGYKWFDVRALSFWEVFDYNSANFPNNANLDNTIPHVDAGFTPVGLFSNFDTPLTPRGAAKAIRGLFLRCTDAAGDKLTFAPPARHITVTGLPPAWASIWGGLPSGGGQWMYCAGTNGLEYIFVWNEQDTTNFTTAAAVNVNFGGTVFSATDYSITHPASGAPVAIQSPTNVSSINMSLLTEVRVIVIRAVAPTASPTGTSLTSNVGRFYSAIDEWSMVEFPTLFVARNGVIIQNTSHGIELLYWLTSVYFHGNVSSVPGWWVWSAGAFRPSADPRGGTTTTVATIRLSGSSGPVTIQNNPPVGTVVGSIDVTMSDGSAFAGTETLGGTDALSFTINAGNLLTAASAAPSVYDDEFTSATAGWLAHEFWQAGDSWSYVSTDIPLGRGGPNTTEFGDQWWVNPLNPSTSIGGLYVITGGQLVLALTNTPPANQAYIDNAGGKHLPYVGCLMNNQNVLWRRFGYYEFSVAVEKLAGFCFQWTIESMNPWNSEIDVVIGTRSDGVMQVGIGLSGDLNFGATFVYTTTTVDITLQHVYAVDWQSGFIRFYIDGAQVYQISTATATSLYGQFSTSSMFTYLLTAANYQFADGDPDTGSLPKRARMNYYRVYAAKPSTLVPGTYAVAITASQGSSVLTTNFQIIVAGATATLTGITLSGTSVTAGASAPATIGTIAVQATGGAFTGALTISDTTHFQLSGNTLQTKVALTTGTYPLGITATQAGAAGSPLLRNFSIVAATSGGVGPGVTSGITVDFTAQTTKTVYREAFGVSTDTMCDFNFLICGTPGFQTASRTIDPPILRFNSSGGGGGGFPSQNAFPGAGNDPPDLTPDWSVYDPLIANLYKIVNLATCKIMMCFGGGSPGQDFLGWSSDTFAAAMALVVDHFRTTPGGNGAPIDPIYWEVSNEPDVGPDAYNEYFNKCADAIHAIDSKYVINGPVMANEFDYVTGLIAASNASRLGMLNGHYYDYCPGRDPTPSDDECCQAITGGSGTTPEDFATGAGHLNDSVAGTFMEGKPFFLGEYQIGCGPADGRENTIIGACYAASNLMKLIAVSDVPIWAGNWEYGPADSWGIIQPNGDEFTAPSYNIMPPGYFFSKATKVVPGRMVDASNTSGVPVLVWGTKNGTKFCVVMVNYSNGPVSQTVALSHWPVNTSGTLTVHKWELSAAHPQGLETTLAVTGGLTTAVNIPGHSIVLIYP